jgi:hypothetical protein
MTIETRAKTKKIYSMMISLNLRVISFPISFSACKRFYSKATGNIFPSPKKKGNGRRRLNTKSTGGETILYLQIATSY